MRVPLSWLREYVDLPAGGLGARAWPTRWSRVGLEVETVEDVGADLAGAARRRPGARVIDELPSQRKTDPVVPVDVGARRAAAGSSAARATSPSATSSWSRCPARCCPAGSTIAARKTYGHVSDGMICSARELGLGDDHAGILVLPRRRRPGRRRDDARPCSGCATTCSTSRSPRTAATACRCAASPARSRRGLRVCRSATRRRLPAAGRRTAPAGRCGSRTRRAATGSSRARCAASTRGADARAGCSGGCRWPGCGRSRWPSTSPTT